MFVIGGVQKTTLVDFPRKVAAIVFTQGCNFRCGYCHNPDLLEIKQICPPELYKGNRRGTSSVTRYAQVQSAQIVSESFTKEKFLSFLQTRINKLDGVVITGGEPTLQSGLYDFIKEIKQMNFDVKLDTNGTNPQIIEHLIKDNLLDYIAMDIKAPLEKYPQIVNIVSRSEGEGVRERVNFVLNNIQKSIKIIMQSNVDYEFRTTVLKSQLSYEDFDQIGQMIKGAKRYYLQKFVSSEIFDKNLLNEQTYTNEEFKTICQNLKKYVAFADYR